MCLRSVEPGNEILSEPLSPTDPSVPGPSEQKFENTMLWKGLAAAVAVFAIFAELITGNPYYYIATGIGLIIVMIPGFLLEEWFSSDAKTKALPPKENAVERSVTLVAMVCEDSFPAPLETQLPFGRPVTPIQMAPVPPSVYLLRQET